MQTYIPQVQAKLAYTNLPILLSKMIPSVGIVIPCYNHEKYILEAIQSVIDQDYSSKLIIVVDDASTDNSFEVVKNKIHIKSFFTDYEGCEVIVGTINSVPILLIKQVKNKKQAAARNKAIQSSWNYCNFYCQLDADDKYLPQKLSKSVKVLLTDPINIGLVYCDVFIFNDETNSFVHEMREPYSRTRLEQEDIISNAPLINKSVFIDVGLYDELMPLCEDWDLWLRITEKYFAIHIPEPLQMYRVTGQSCTYTVPKEVWNQQWTKIQQKIYLSKNKIK